MRLQLHWQIIIGLVLGTLFGIFAATNQLSGFTQDWIAPFGTIFVNLLKLIAVPLVLASLVTGVASLADLAKLSRIGGKTIAIYLATTTAAITIGLILVNTLRPGDAMPEQVSQQLKQTYKTQVEERAEVAGEVEERGPLRSSDVSELFRLCGTRRAPRSAPASRSYTRAAQVGLGSEPGGLPSGSA